MKDVLPEPFKWCEIPGNPAFKLLTDILDLGTYTMEPFLMAMYSIGWYNAMAFCNWLGVRPQTEWEWQWAAQTPDGHAYPWGVEYIRGYAIIDEIGSNIPGEDFRKQTSPVDNHPRRTDP